MEETGVVALVVVVQGALGTDNSYQCIFLWLEIPTVF